MKASFSATADRIDFLNREIDRVRRQLNNDNDTATAERLTAKLRRLVQRRCFLLARYTCENFE